jgi:murein DD-endopeptidase MepM/ murein hydrolase activator NlpD
MDNVPRRLSAALRGCLVFVCVLNGLAFVGTPAQAAYGGLRLPFPPGRAYVITQTPGAFQNCALTGGSHCIGNDVWAYDFGLHIGDQIAAAHSGTVIRYVAGFGIGSCDPAFRNDANYIVLDHGDGYSSIYWHISYNSASVSPGEFVAQGHPVADAGAAGIVCGNPGDHLHFAVEPTPLDGQSATTSVQIRFDEAGEPALGTAPVSANRPRYSATYVGGSDWVVLGNGEHRATTGLWRNTGWGTWSQANSRIGTVSPEPGHDQVSVLIGTNRVGQAQATVRPGEVASYPFELIGPATPGIYRLYLRPVIDGITWMEDQGVFWLVDRR